MPSLLSIIVPCFNEEESIVEVYNAIEKSCAEINHETIFVDDGSSDRTVLRVNELSEKDSSVSLVGFQKNIGHQHAIRAGLKKSKGTYILTLDADLQHPPSYISDMLQKGQEGYDVVNMVRSGGQSGLFKNLFSKGFYWFFNLVSDVPIEPNVSDFRLMSRRVVDVLNSLPERNLVLRIILPYLGFKAYNMSFEIQERKFGSNSYTFYQSWRLAYNSIFNFSSFPLDIGLRLGVVIAGLAFLYGFYAIYGKLFTDNNLPGYTDIITSILFLGGIILVYLGILGRYIGVILEHLKDRPEYLLNSDNKKSTED